jgi:hypothetical protein
MIITKSLIEKDKKNYCQHTFCEIANYVVNSRLSFARNLVVTENTRLRSSQPRKAWERWWQFSRRIEK